MARTVILCFLALIGATLAYPADVVPQVPQVPAKTQVATQLVVHPAESPLEPEPLIKDRRTQAFLDQVKTIPRNQQAQGIPDLPEAQKAQEEQVVQAQEEQVAQEEAQAEAEEDLAHPEDIPSGIVGPDIASNPDANPDQEDTSDLEGANTFWGGWGRRWGGWGGGWGGGYGYHYPRRHYGWGHGYGRGHYGHYGYGRGYGGYGGYYG